MLERRLHHRAAGRPHRYALRARALATASASTSAPTSASTAASAAASTSTFAFAFAFASPPHLRPPLHLTGMRTELQLSLPPLTPHGSVWPVNATVTVTDCGGGGGGAHLLAQLNLSLWSGDPPADGGRDLLRQHRIPVPRWPRSGYTEVGVRLEALQGDAVQGDDNGTPPPLWAAACGSGGGAARVRVWSVPPWLSILPPVATLLLAVWLRQVMVGLLVGIWLGATIAYGGNPLTG